MFEISANEYTRLGLLAMVANSVTAVAEIPVDTPTAATVIPRLCTALADATVVDGLSDDPSDSSTIVADPPR